jgi:hypothetical protein
LPTSLVVKNGSKIREATSGAMPGPVSRTTMTRVSGVVAVGAASIVTTPPPDMASRALTARFSRALSNWAGSTWTHSGVGANLELDADGLADGLAEQRREVG